MKGNVNVKGAQITAKTVAEGSYLCIVQGGKNWKGGREHMGLEPIYRPLQGAPCCPTRALVILLGELSTEMTYCLYFLIDHESVGLAEKYSFIFLSLIKIKNIYILYGRETTLIVPLTWKVSCFRVSV